MPPLLSGMTDRPVVAPCGHAISRNDMPGLIPFNLSYARPKNKNVNDLHMGACNSGRVYIAGDRGILYIMTLWLVRS